MVLNAVNLDNQIIRTTDVGSFPLRDIDSKLYGQGAADVEDGTHSEAALYFIRKHNEAFKRKLVALGSDQSVPCYVQSSYSRDMLSQFLDQIIRHGSGLEKNNDLYLWDGTPIHLPPENAQIGELLALKNEAKAICDELSIEQIRYRACITGPFEMAIRLWRGMGVSAHYEESLIETFSRIVQGYMKNANLETKYFKPLVLTLDEPSIGVKGVGDFFVDSESDHRLSHLISQWNTIFSIIPRGCYKGLHLHASPFHQLVFAQWNLLEAHIGAILSPEWLVENDKYIRSAIMRTDGPTIPNNTDLKAAWSEIQSGNFHPYLQSRAEMKQYLMKAINRYGFERIPFAGPECGLGSWDWKYGEAMVLASLERLKDVINEVNTLIR